MNTPDDSLKKGQHIKNNINRPRDQKIISTGLSFDKQIKS